MQHPAKSLAMSKKRQLRTRNMRRPISVAQSILYPYSKQKYFARLLKSSINTQNKLANSYLDQQDYQMYLDYRFYNKCWGDISDIYYRTEFFLTWSIVYRRSDIVGYKQRSLPVAFILCASFILRAMVLVFTFRRVIANVWFNFDTGNIDGD